MWAQVRWRLSSACSGLAPFDRPCSTLSDDWPRLYFTDQVIAAQQAAGLVQTQDRERLRQANFFRDRIMTGRKQQHSDAAATFRELDVCHIFGSSRHLNESQRKCFVSSMCLGQKKHVKL